MEIIERERHHELLLSVKNLLDLGANPFLYIVPILPRPLPNEVVKGEHFVFPHLLKLLPRGSTQAEPLIWLDCLPLVVQNPNLAPQVVTKKKKKSRQVKAVDEGLEGFVDWTNMKISQSTEEREVEMTGLVVGFSIQIRKRAANA